MTRFCVLGTGTIVLGLANASITQRGWNPQEEGWGAALQHAYQRRLDVIGRGFSGTLQLFCQTNVERLYHWYNPSLGHCLHRACKSTTSNDHPEARRFQDPLAHPFLWRKRFYNRRSSSTRSSLRSLSNIRFH
jgi:hypothetical protein